jgi:nicotinate-nucleotide adenylyltransferase
MKKNKRIGIFGGSFDPIHLGHLILAQSALESAALHVIYFTPTAAPPHKEGAHMTDFGSRRKMVELAIEDNPQFELSLIESNARPAYTIETVMAFREKGFSREQIHLIMGRDSLEEMDGWKDPDRIFENATIIAMERAGGSQPIRLPDNAALVMLSSCSNSISSSEIRQRVAEGRSIRYLVPEPVERFIREKGLYPGNT